MHTSLDVLRRYVDLPDDPAVARRLLDEVGVEVKRIDPQTAGVPLSLELLANRGDHHGLVGLAREVHGRTGTGVRSPAPEALPVGDLPVPVLLQTELCPAYTLTLLERTSDGVRSAVSDHALAVLAAAGLESKGPVVDATNLVNLELGQPTHAFDADKVNGPVVVRLSVADEPAWPLFAEAPVALPAGLLVIADSDKILAIAGVIGCEESKATDATTRVLLESATFDPIAVRKAGTALALHTDARARFERGADPALPAVGAAYVAQILAPCGWQITGSLGRVGDGLPATAGLRLSVKLANDFLGLDLSADEMAERLGRYGFELVPAGDGHFQVDVPSWRRWDVETVADLYEELAKSVGYDAIPVTLPSVPQGATPSLAEQAQARVEDVLLGHGYYEVITDGFYSRALIDKLGLPEGHVLHAHVQTANALDRAYSLLKNTCLPQALEGVVANRNRQHHEFKAYEFTRTFHPDPQAANGVCRERRVLWAMALGHERSPTWRGAERPADVHHLLGVVEEIAATLRRGLTVQRVPADHPLAALLHPGRSAQVLLEGVAVGVVGEVHPRLRNAFKLKKARPVYLELDHDALLTRGPAHRFEEPPRVPDVNRSLAFSLPRGVEAADVLAVLRDHGPSWLRDVAVTDRFDHALEDGTPVSTLTFTLAYINAEGDRTAESMNSVTEGLIAAVHEALGARGVTLR